MKRTLILGIALLSWIGSMNVMAVDVTLSSEEKELYRLIMQYRAEKGLPSIPLSPALTYVAQTHVRDLQAHPRAEGCNLHSWSDYGDWSPVCYTKDPTEEAKKAVWNKPRELTTYPGAGYEISFWHSAAATATNSINGWKNSPPHNATMINQGIWADRTWGAIGIGIYKEYAVVWFGEEEDKAAVKEQPKEPETVTVIQEVYVPQKDEETEQRLKELEAQQQAMIAQQEKEIQKLQAEQKKLQSELQKSKQKQDNSGYRVKEKPEKPNRQKPERQPREINRDWLDRYYDHSGFSSLSYFSAGYTYSCMSGSHLINVSMLDFRVAMFGASLLNAEMSVSPFNKRFAYKPNLRIYFPIAKCLAVVPYGGAEVDASYVGSYLDKNYTYDVDNDFYVSALGGVALNLTAARCVPMEIKVEYRHPVYGATANAVNPQGVYVGAQIYIGSYFPRKR